MLKIFYDTIPERAGELEGFYQTEDWKNYAVKVHALKSSARLVGALQLGEQAQQQEDAAKKEDVPYLRECHQGMLENYKAYRSRLKGLFVQDEAGKAEESKKLVADADLMAIFYEELGLAAGKKDGDSMRRFFKEMEEYSIPPSEAELFDQLKDASLRQEFDQILVLLGQM